MPNKRTKKKTAELRRDEETRWLYEARLSGYSSPQVADLASAHFGRPFSPGLVRKRIEEWQSRHVVEGVSQLRRIEADRLDRMLAALERDIMLPPGQAYDEEGEPLKVDLDDRRVKAIDRALRVSAQRAKLLGLDAPTQIEARVVNVAPVDLEMEELAEAVKRGEA